MIFVALGSQKFQFNRLLKKIDSILEKKEITDEVYAQIGYSSYKPKHYDFKEFLSTDDFNKKIQKSNILITHAGTGSIMAGIRNNKKVIAVPRLSKYNEHVDNHQIEICQQFEKMGLIIVCWNLDDLVSLINERTENKIYLSGNSLIQDFIIDFINH